jgi:hypothetical protein
MARGWESKSVEEQMAETAAKPQGKNPEELTDEEKKQIQIVRAAKLRQKQGLELQKARILGQRTSSPIRRQELEAALGQIEGELAKLA